MKNYKGLTGKEVLAKIIDDNVKAERKYEKITERQAEMDAEDAMNGVEF